jgi:hypothetical protein
MAGAKRMMIKKAAAGVGKRYESSKADKKADASAMKKLAAKTKKMK